MSTVIQAHPAVLYAAKSTEDKAGSIATQMSDCEAMAQREGWAVVGRYHDENASAYHGSRGPELARAREHAERLAVEHGQCALVVQHTDRLARGDGIAGQHLVEVLLWARKAGVRVRSVQDDQTGENLLLGVVMGERNHEDSRRKAQATAAGKRRAAERGLWQGTAADGYLIQRSIDGASVARRVEFDPERFEVWRLVWDLALDGATVVQTVRELAIRGYLTRPYPRRGAPRPFDTARVQKGLRNPFYAGQLVHRGEVLGDGHWPRYVEPEDFYRLKRERTARRRHQGQPVGRPPGGLLARLARCGECGGACVHYRSEPRKDGTRARRYICETHKRRSGAIDGCSAAPYDAELAERMILGGLRELLGEADAWASAVLAGRDAQRVRLEAEALAAAREVAHADAAIEQLTARYEAAVLAGDIDERELAKRAMASRRTAIDAANVRQEAACDALSAMTEEPVGDDADRALARLWRGLSAGLSAADGDTKALNALLRVHFEAFRLRRHGDELHITPVICGDALDSALRERAARSTIDGVPADVQLLDGSLADVGARARLAVTIDAADAHRLGVGSLVEVSAAGPATLTDQNPQRPST